MSVFPSELPASLDNAYVIREHDWRAFRQLTRMENHWDQPGWTTGRRSYHWMLSFDTAGELQRLAKQCQARLPVAVLDPVPLDALHLTIGRIGFTDEVAEETALAVARQAVRDCRALAPFDLVIGPLAGSTGAIRFSVAPWTPLLRLHRYLATATRATLGEYSVMETSQFRPHLSIAYANTVVPVSSLIPILKKLRTHPTVVVNISSVGLVELRREGPAYRYTEVMGIRFGYYN